MFSDKKKLSASSTSSAALEGLASDLKQPDLFGPSLSVSRTSSAKPSCESTGPTFQSLTTCEPSQQMDLEELTSSSVASHASPGPKPGSKEARQMTVTSGRKWLPLLKSYNLAGQFAKMCGALLVNQWASSAAYLTWRASATKPSHLSFRLAPSMPRTDATASGLLHTPTSKANQMAPSMKNRDPGSWWPTPVARDYKGQGMSRERRETREPDNLCSWTAKYEGSAALNPAFVEWMMGFPAGWTNLTPQELQTVSKTECRGLKPSETPSFRKLSRKSGGR